MAAASNEPKSSWYDWSKAAGDDPAPEASAAEPPAAPGDDPAATDEFGVQLRWPAGTVHPTDAAGRLPRPGRLAPVTGSAADAADPSAPPLVPLLAARFEMLEARLSMLILRSDAQGAAAEQAFEAITARLDGLAAAVADIEVPAGGGSDDGGVESLRIALDDLIADVAGLRDDLTQVRRRLPVRAKATDSAAELQPLADLIVARLMERFELADPVQPADPPDPAAKRPRRGGRLRS